MSSDRIVTESDIFLNRGLASYELERYHEAVEDFKRITEPELLGINIIIWAHLIFK